MGGQIEDGVFVTQPGVALIAKSMRFPARADAPAVHVLSTNTNQTNQHVSFLLCGVSNAALFELTQLKFAIASTMPTLSKSNASLKYIYKIFVFICSF